MARKVQLKAKILHCHFKHSEVSARIYSKLVLCVAILVVKACKC